MQNNPCGRPSVGVGAYFYRFPKGHSSPLGGMATTWSVFEERLLQTQQLKD
jgi:hypothetical protein